MTPATITALVGVPACARTRDGERVRFDQPARYCEALLGGAGVVPVMLPPLGPAMLAALPRLDGLLLPGSPSNVHPDEYDGGESETPELHDPARDATTLPLIRAALAQGVPLLAICRGIQELNVALGGTLHQRVHALDGRHDHRGGEGPVERRYGPKHPIEVCGGLAAVLGGTSVMVNSLHGQAIDRPADRLVPEAWAPDGTLEGVRVADASAFAYGVQWHPEWDYAKFPESRALFAAFGDACRARAAAR